MDNELINLLLTHMPTVGIATHGSFCALARDFTPRKLLQNITASDNEIKSKILLMSRDRRHELSKFDEEFRLLLIDLASKNNDIQKTKSKETDHDKKTSDKHLTGMFIIKLMITINTFAKKVVT